VERLSNFTANAVIDSYQPSFGEARGYWET
jgi:hypothetical protein